MAEVPAAAINNPVTSVNFSREQNMAKSRQGKKLIGVVLTVVAGLFLVLKK
jgi:hypothetical protein